MRYLVLGLCGVAVACAGTAPSVPTAPSSANTALSSTESVVSVMGAGGSELPFSGTLQATETEEGALHRLSGAGEATHLGRFTLISEFTVIPPPVSTASGTATWTAANGDQIFTTTAGHAVITFPVAAIAETGTITGGTGRFDEASGTILVQRSLNLLTFISSASITGTISLGH